MNQKTNRKNVAKESNKVIEMKNSRKYYFKRLREEIAKEEGIENYYPGMFLEKVIDEDEKLMEEYLKDKGYYLRKEIDVIRDMYVKDEIYLYSSILVPLNEDVIRYDIIRYIYNKLRIYVFVYFEYPDENNNLDYETLKNFMERNKRYIDNFDLSFRFDNYLSHIMNNGIGLIRSTHIEKIAEQIAKLLKLVDKDRRTLTLQKTYFRQKKRMYYYQGKIEDFQYIYMMIGNLIFEIYPNVLDKRSVKEIMMDVIQETDEIEGAVFVTDQFFNTIEEKMQENGGSYYNLYIVDEDVVKNTIKEKQLKLNETSQSFRIPMEDILQKAKLLSSGKGIRIAKNNRYGYAFDILIRDSRIISRTDELLTINNIIIDSNNEVYCNIGVYSLSVLEQVRRYIENNVIYLKRKELTYNEKCRDFTKKIVNKQRYFANNAGIPYAILSYITNDDNLKELLFRVLQKVEIDYDRISIVSVDSKKVM